MRRVGCRRNEVGDPEENQFFIAEARRRIETANALKRLRHEPDFLLAFTDDRVLGTLTVVDATRRHLPEFPVHARAVLTNQYHLPIVAYRNDHNGRAMPDDLHLVLPAVGKATAVDLDGKNATIEDNRHD